MLVTLVQNIPSVVNCRKHNVDSFPKRECVKMMVNLRAWCNFFLTAHNQVNRTADSVV